MKTNKITGDRLFEGVNITFMLLFAAITLYPLWREVSISLSHGDAAFSGGLFLWPVDFSTAAYSTLFGNSMIWITFRNSIFVAVVGTVLNVALTAATAYPLTKSIVPGRRLMIMAILFTMLFSGGVIPNYLLIKSLGLINSLWSLILPSLITAYNALIMISFFQAIPGELEESAEMDGANPIRTFVSIIIPLSAPVLATIALWSAVGHWNEFFAALLYINERGAYTLPLLLRDLITGNDYVRMTGEKVDTATETVIAATIVVTILPILSVYPFLQKYFVKGVMIGSVKG